MRNTTAVIVVMLLLLLGLGFEPATPDGGLTWVPVAYTISR